MVWYSQHFKNFPPFDVIHTVKGFDVVNKAKVDVFLELSYFFDDPVDIGSLISGSSAPTAAFQKGGGRLARGRWEEEKKGGEAKEKEEGRCCRRDWAGSRRGGRGGRRGWAASQNPEEGRILEAQDKQIVPLHVRGGGRWGVSAVASPLPLPPAGSLSRNAR